MSPICNHQNTKKIRHFSPKRDNVRVRGKNNFSLKWRILLTRRVVSRTTLFVVRSKWSSLGLIKHVSAAFVTTSRHLSPLKIHALRKTPDPNALPFRARANCDRCVFQYCRPTLEQGARRKVPFLLKRMQKGAKRMRVHLTSVRRTSARARADLPRISLEIQPINEPSSPFLPNTRPSSCHALRFAIVKACRDF